MVRQIGGNDGKITGFFKEKKIKLSVKDPWGMESAAAVKKSWQKVLRELQGTILVYVKGNLCGVLGTSWENAVGVLDVEKEKLTGKFSEAWMSEDLKANILQGWDKLCEVNL